MGPAMWLMPISGELGRSMDIIEDSLVCLEDLGMECVDAASLSSRLSLPLLCLLREKKPPPLPVADCLDLSAEDMMVVVAVVLVVVVVVLSGQPGRGETPTLQCFPPDECVIYPNGLKSLMRKFGTTRSRKDGVRG